MASPLTEAAVQVAVSQLGTRERGHNAGPEVETYLASVGLGAGYAWCAAFLFWTFRQAAARIDAVSPVPRTAGCQRLWHLADNGCRVHIPTRGCVYVLAHEGGSGHVGIVESVAETGTMSEISGNTNQDGSREGDSVWRHTGASPQAIHGGKLLGYLDFGLAKQPALVT